MNRLLRALMLLVVLGSLVVAGLAGLFVNEIKKAVDPDDTEVITFEIAPGETAADVAQNLKQVDLIRQPVLFNLMARQRGVADKLEAGQFQLQRRMTTGEIITALQNSKVEEKQFTVIEGMRLEEVARVLVDANLAPSTEAAEAVMRNAEAFKPGHVRLKDIPDEQSLEGYLFPNTYRVLATATITDVVNTMLDEFDTNYADFENEITVQNFTTHEIVTMASIVQREAAGEAEMPHIAWVLWNRLKPEYEAEVAGRLQADPTVQYAAGYDNETQTWWRKNIDDVLDINSPYNTRVNKGLPPGPIANPGLRALRSAARPGTERPDGTPGEDDLYFVATCNGSSSNFAANYDEFTKLEQAYLACPS